jgi:hypothetical protein
MDFPPWTAVEAERMSGENPVPTASSAAYFTKTISAAKTSAHCCGKPSHEIFLNNSAAELHNVAEHTTCVGAGRLRKSHLLP